MAIYVNGIFGLNTGMTVDGIDRNAKWQFWIKTWMPNGIDAYVNGIDRNVSGIFRLKYVCQ